MGSGPRSSPQVPSLPASLTSSAPLTPSAMLSPPPSQKAVPRASERHPIPAAERIPTASGTAVVVLVPVEVMPKPVGRRYDAASIAPQCTLSEPSALTLRGVVRPVRRPVSSRSTMLSSSWCMAWRRLVWSCLAEYGVMRANLEGGASGGCGNGVARLWASEAASKPLARHGAAAPRQSGWRPLPCSSEMTRAFRRSWLTHVRCRPMTSAVVVADETGRMDGPWMQGRGMLLPLDCCGGSRCTSLLFAACLALRFEALRCRSSDSSTSGDVMHVERAGRVVVSKAWCVAPSTQQGRAASRPCVHRQRRGGVLAMAWKP